MENIDLLVCIDCLFVLANGVADEGDERVVAAMSKEWPPDLFQLVPACPEDCEGNFMWSRCEGCGSSLGGDRHPAVAFPKPIGVAR